MSIPTGTITVRTYAEFRDYVACFAAGQLPMLLIIGPPGVSKSQTVKRALETTNHLYVETHATARGLYDALYGSRNLPVVIDDLDSLFNDRAAVRLLKSLCNTDPIKTLRWVSKANGIGTGAGQVPSEFQTRSSVCLIANEWKTVNENVRAIEDRAIVIQFDPTPSEIHQEVGRWFEDREVYDHIGSMLPYITTPSMRHYIKGSNLRRMGLANWPNLLAEIMGIEKRTVAVVELLRRPCTDKERVAEFLRLGLGSRMTYYRLKRVLYPLLVDPDLMPERDTLISPTPLGNVA